MEENHQQEVEFKRGRSRLAPLSSSCTGSDSTQSWRCRRQTRRLCRRWLSSRTTSSKKLSKRYTGRDCLCRLMDLTHHLFILLSHAQSVSLRLDQDTGNAKQDRFRSDSPLLELTGGDQTEKGNVSAPPKLPRRRARACDCGHHIGVPPQQALPTRGSPWLPVLQDGNAQGNVGAKLTGNAQ